MDPKDAVMFVMMFICFGVPALAITARLIMKPMVDSIIRLRESSGGAASGVVERRMLELEDEVSQLRASLSGLEETVAFQQNLLTGAGAEPTALAAPGAER
ncbi:MAG TPA: hypothetical protein VF541_09395 [Longimicrobium sp.]|jgi:hypothetical protein